MINKDELYEELFPKYCEWMRDQYLDNPNRKTIHPYEYVSKIIDLVVKEIKNKDAKAAKLTRNDRIY